MTRVVDVLVPVAVDTAYSYRAPADLTLEPGAFVGVPLGTRHATGVVWATREAGGDNLKSVSAVRDWPPLQKPLRDFIDWVARWTLSPRGMVLRMAIRAHEVLEPPAPKIRPRRDRQGAHAHDRGAWSASSPRSKREPRRRPRASSPSSPAAP